MKNHVTTKEMIVFCGVFLICTMLAVLVLAFAGGSQEPASSLNRDSAALCSAQPYQAKSQTVQLKESSAGNIAERLMPSDLTYLGAFRLPDNFNWACSWPVQLS